MSESNRASLPELALGGAVLAADTVSEAVSGFARRTVAAGRKTVAGTIGAGSRAVTGARDTAVQNLYRRRDAGLSKLRSTAEAQLTWVETTIVPRVVDDLMPYLTSSVLPRMIDAALPQIREKVVPIVIADLAESEELRELITEQSRDVVADAASDLRDSTAAADDRLETGFRRIFHLSAAR
ncbi:hypothetical protein [Hamadaea tsunoensis]|uniref:hypothetical protein n=1 Tax=Hamadaea tsunoensis TaxID=53368 RepID=UPI000484B407|nr:hypothetical protein [Hamadaea tsunoensis]